MLRIVTIRSSRFKLEKNYPNPFKTSTTITYYLSHPSDVTIKIYNVQGELVTMLSNNEIVSTGLHNVVWNGKNSSEAIVSSGVYLYQLIINESSVTKKMLLLK